MAGMMDRYPKMMDEPEADDNPAEESSELKDAASAAFPDQEWDESRLSALKDLIMLCSGSDYADDGGGDEEESSGSKGPGKSVLALMFGGKKK